MNGREPEKISLLLVEDNPSDRDLLIERLGEASGAFAMSFAASLEEAVAYLGERRADVVLLDLNLPDARGVETVSALRRAASDVPIVVFTGLDDEEIGLQALQEGAQDYLVKGAAGGELIARTLRYAMERHRLQRALRHEREQRARDRERLALAGLGEKAGVTAELYGALPLARAAPQRFEQLRDEYIGLLEAALEAQVMRTGVNTSAALDTLADRMGELGAGPRDVVDLHKSALELASRDAPWSKAEALTVEGRFAVLELMGHLVSYYRRRSALWSRRGPGTTNGAARATGAKKERS